MSGPYDFYLTDGSLLVSVEPLENNGTGNASVPRQVLNIIFQDPNIIPTPADCFVVADDVTTRFVPGFLFDIIGGSPYDGTYVVSNVIGVNSTAVQVAPGVYQTHIPVDPTTPIISSTSIHTLGVITPGTLYTPGTYLNVPLIHITGVGTGATANITVDVTGAVTAVALVELGTGYAVSDILSATPLTGVFSTTGHGSGFTIPVASVGHPINYQFHAQPTITPGPPHNYTVTWSLLPAYGDLTSIIQAGNPIIIQNASYNSNPYYQELIVSNVMYNGTFTSISTPIVDPTLITPVITVMLSSPISTLVNPPPPLPFGYITYSLGAVTSLELVGRGAATYNNEGITWGQAIQDNMIHMLENFAYISAPPYPITGQLWYDTSPPTPQLFIWNGSTWTSIGGGGPDADPYLPLVGGTMTGSINMGGNNITNIVMSGSPASTDVVNVGYVNALVSGLNVHPAVDYMSTASDAHASMITGATVTPGSTDQNGGTGIGMTITAAAPNVALIVDGNTVNLDERVLVNQGVIGTGTTYNGIYSLTQIATALLPWILTRATDDDDHIINQVIPGDFTFIQEGTTYHGTGWVETALGTGGPGQAHAHPGASDDAIVIGTDNASYAQFSGAGTYSAGTGLLLTGTVFSLNTPVSIANGGTNAITASAGFNNLSPITTTGDLIIGNGVNSATRLPIGANTYVLTSNGTTASWQSVEANLSLPYDINMFVSGYQDDPGVTEATTIFSRSGTLKATSITVVYYAYALVAPSVAAYYEIYHYVAPLFPAPTLIGTVQFLTPGTKTGVVYIATDVALAAGDVIEFRTAAAHSSDPTIQNVAVTLVACVPLTPCPS